jgi:hypothetical protein
VVKVPAAGALNAEKHLYEEVYRSRAAPPPRCGTFGFAPADTSRLDPAPAKPDCIE